MMMKLVRAMSCCLTALLLMAMAAQAGELVDGEPPVNGRYLVVYRDGVVRSGSNGVLAGPSVAEVARDLALVHGGRVRASLERALHGATMEMDPSTARRVAADPRVELVLPDRAMELDAVSTPLATHWGVDRIDERSLPMNNHYTYSRAGYGVNIYIVDSGVLPSSSRFGSRLVLAYSTEQDAGGNPVWGDPVNHGTLVANFAAGSQDGVARAAIVHAVRIENALCSGGGEPKPPLLFGQGDCLSFAGALEALDWLIGNHQKPAVANLSFGLPEGLVGADLLQDAVRDLIAAGVTVVATAGNSNGPACGHVPGNVAQALTVGATDRSDARASFSNWDSCVDLFAPGDDLDDSPGVPNSEVTGTSFAAPLVTGAAALYLQGNRSATPSQVASYILGNATMGRISDLKGSPDRLLFVPPGGDEIDDLPLADFTHSCSGTPVTCSFTSTSTDDFGQITGCSWSFGDGNAGTGCQVSHTYGPLYIGKKVSVHLTVFDDAGQAGGKYRVITVGSLPQTKSFAPVADAYISDDSKDSNYGSLSLLRIQKQTNGVGGKAVLLKFYLSKISGDVESAVLKLRTSSNYLSSAKIHHVCNSGWSEDSVTWNNAPWTYACGELGVKAGLAGSTWHSFDVTQAVDGNGYVSFALVTETDANANRSFYSKESIYDPVLEVTYQE